MTQGFINLVNTANTVVISDDTATNATMYPTWVTASSGSLPLKVSSTKLFYNPSTSLLTNIGALGQVTSFVSSAGAKVLEFNYAASAVNYVGIQSASASSSPVIVAVGTDSTIRLTLASKNLAVDVIDSTATQGGKISFRNAANTHGTDLTVASAQATDVTFTLPAADAAGYMVSDGSGNLSLLGTFTDISGSTTPNGFSSVSTETVRSLAIGKMVFLQFTIIGTSNATTFTLTGLPISGASSTQFYSIMVTNNGTNAGGLVTVSGTTLTFYNNDGTNPAGWTNSGTKAAYGSIWYEAS